MFIICILLPLLSLSKVTFWWVSVPLEVIILQTLVLYYLYRLLVMKNLYQLAGYASLLLISLASYLFWLQLDVFACFLLVAESIVILFVLSLLMHLNYTNISSQNKSTFSLVALLLLAFSSVQQNVESFNYWVDWYSSQTSQYNDLLPQYLYFYFLDSPIVLLTGVWLLVLTLLLVHLVLAISFKTSSVDIGVGYFRKSQNIWTQWYKKPMLRFFNKS